MARQSTSSRRPIYRQPTHIAVIMAALALLPLIASVIVFTHCHPAQTDRFNCAECKSGADLASGQTQIPLILHAPEYQLLPLEQPELSGLASIAVSPSNPRAPPFGWRHLAS